MWRDDQTLVARKRVTPNDAGYLRVTVTGLEPGRWYTYTFARFMGDQPVVRSLVGNVRTAPAAGTREPLTIAFGACNGASLEWPAMTETSNHLYDLFLHLGDMVYNDGCSTLSEFRDNWRRYLGAEGYKQVFAGSGLYASWDDHEVTDNFRADSDKASVRRLRNHGIKTFFESLPVRTNGRRLWRSFQWGQTAEFIVLDCRHERSRALGQYISVAQMDWLKQRLLQSPCHFKMILNPVPITNMRGIWDTYAFDRWEGFRQRQELLTFIDYHAVDNVWFLAGDFHVCFSSRLEHDISKPGGKIREFAVTSGNRNYLPLPMRKPQFDFSIREDHAVLLDLDPHANAVRLRFIHPTTGETAFAQTYRYGEV